MNTRMCARRGRRWTTLCLGFALLHAGSARADVASVLPAVFAEPGYHGEWRQAVSGVNEQIDPFSGSLRVSHTDLVLPGNAGLDLVVQRHYSSNVFLSRPSPSSISPYPSTLLSQSPIGQGWTLHFGRAIKAESDERTSNHICSTDFDPNLGDTTLDAGVLELPDGSLDTLYRSDHGPARFVTRRYWLADCTDSGDGLIVYAPNGLKYTMNHAVSALDDVTYTTRLTTAWHTTKIEDGNGNAIDIAYAGQRGSYALVSEVTATDGRRVTFGYEGKNLKSISANGETTSYEYELVGGHSYLRRVVRPDGSAWSYDYAAPGERIAHVLRKITYPLGATVSYTYDYADFMGDPAVRGFDVPRMDSIVVSEKTQAGRGVEPGTWRYTYAPASDPSIEPGFHNDVTTVDFPDGRYVYRHYGMQRQLQIDDTISDRQIWKTGFLRRKETYGRATDGTYELVQTETYDWSTQGVISQQLNAALVYPVIDQGVFAPQLTKRTLVRDGTPYVTEYAYPTLGENGADPRPRRIVETGQATRTTDLVWYPADPTKIWKFDQLLYEIVDGNPRLGTLREFDFETGNLTAYQPRGVVERFRHDAHGNVVESVNARGARIRFEDYYRGVPRREQREVYSDRWVTLKRDVNDTGTVRSETSGRSNTTHYEYDGLARVVAIAKPQGAAVAVGWDATGRTVTRAGYRERTEYDGFGRPLCVEAGDTSLGTRVAVVTRYDALGRKIAASLPFEGQCGSAVDGAPGPGRPGDIFENDVLGRVTSVTHTDHTRVSTEYLPDNRVRVGNERSEVTTYAFRSFGNPDNADERVVLRIDAPEDVTTAFTRNVLGQILTVAQGPSTGNAAPFIRTNTYDPNKNFLLTTTEPETGTTTYTRDEVGNMLSRRVSASPVTNYTYDGLNRLVRSSVTGSSDQALYYDDDNNVTDATYGATWRHYDFDPNGNVTDETLRIDGLQFDVHHAYSSLDYRESTRYHSGRVVTFSPDALGRPTAAAPFVTSATRHPNGEPETIDYANGVRTELSLDERQFTSGIFASGVLGLSYDYDGRGNATRVVDSLAVENERVLGYDGLDRLTHATGVWGVGTFTYDATGNITRAELGARSLGYDYDPERHRLAHVVGDISRTYAYDDSGNITSDANTAFGFDARSHLRSIANGAGTPTLYDYDASGRRVRQQRDGQTLYSFHDKSGALLGEYSFSPGQDRARSKEYAYLDRKLVAAVENEAPLPLVVEFSVAVDEGSNVTLPGRATIAEGTITGFRWSQTSGPPVSLLGAGTQSATFVAPFVTKDTTLAFRLKAFSDRGTSGYANVYVTVRDLKVDLDHDGMADGWELEYFGSLAESATSDPDGDGVDNGHEFDQGTNPSSPSAPTPVRGLTVIPGTDSNTIAWVPSFGAAPSYDLYLSRQAGFDPNSADAPNSTGTVRKLAVVTSPFVHAGLAAGETYYYRVVARSAFGVALPSPEQRATVGRPGFDYAVPLATRSRTEMRRGGLSLSADGTAFAIWAEWDATLKIGRIWAARYEPGSGFREPFLLEEVASSGIDPEPVLAMDARGNALAAWANGTTLRSSSFMPSTGWQPPSTVSAMPGDSPALAMNPSGRAILLWYSTRTHVFEYDPGVGWSENVTLEGGSHGANASQATISDDGDAAVLFDGYDPSGTASVSALTRDGTRGWSRPAVIAAYSNSESRHLRLAMDPGGRATAAWWQVEHNNQRGIAVWAARHRIGSSWGKAERLDADDGTRFNDQFSDGLALATDGAGRVHLAWKQIDAVNGSDVARTWGVEYARDTDTWSDPELLSGDTRPNYRTLLLEPAGDGVLLWSAVNDLSMRRYLVGSGWQVETTREVGSGGVSGIDQRGNISLLTSSSTRVPMIRHYWQVNGGVRKNVPPAVNAGLDRAVLPRAMVQLSGERTRDSDGTVIAHRWSQVKGPAVDLADSTSIAPSFTAPAADAEAVVLAFRLNATDDDGAENSDTVHVTIPGPSSDTDADGLGDRWEVGSFGDLSAWPDEDPDRDGISNLQESREGTDPTRAEPRPAQVVGLRVTGGSATQNNLQWSATLSAARYNLYWRNSPGVTTTNGTKIAGASSPYAHPNLTMGTTYYYVVTAENGSGESRESAEVSFTPHPAVLGAWRTAQRIEQGGRTASSVLTGLDDNGTGVAAWLDLEGNLFTNMLAPTTGWSSPTNQDFRGQRLVDLAAEGDGGFVLLIEPAASAELWALHWDGGAWLAPEHIADTFTDAAVVAGDAGDALAVFLSGDRHALWSRRRTGAEGWGEPQLVIDVTTPGATPSDIASFDLAMSATGTAFIAWEETLHVTPEQDRHSILVMHAARDSSWTEPQLVDATHSGDHFGPRVVASENGDAVVTWRRDYLPYGTSIQAARFGLGVGDDAPVTVLSGGADQVNLVGNARGDALLAWTPISGTRVGWNGFVLGEGWGTPSSLRDNGSAGTPHFLALAMNALGDGLAVWRQIDDAAALWASAFEAGAVNQPPTADAGSDQSVNEGTQVSLSGTGSDPDGAVTHYAWTQVSGPSVTLTRANTSAAAFVAPNVSATTTLSFRLSVTDDSDATGSDTVDVVVRDVPPPFRDLVMTSVTTSSTRVAPGGTFSVVNTATNSGTAGITTAFTVRLYLSTDATITTSDTVVATRQVSTLTAGAGNTAQTTATVPTTLAPGSYFLGAIADTTNTIAEANETNNTLTGNPLTVARDVDLVVTALSASANSVARGGSLTLSNTVKNQGSQSTTTTVNVRLYLSSDATITTDDILFTTRTVQSLAGGATNAANTRITVPQTLSVGSYFIGAIVDPTDAQLETDETNNARSGTRIDVR